MQARLVINDVAGDGGNRAHVLWVYPQFDVLDPAVQRAVTMVFPNGTSVAVVLPANSQEDYSPNKLINWNPVVVGYDEASASIYKAGARAPKLTVTLYQPPPFPALASLAGAITVIYTFGAAEMIIKTTGVIGADCRLIATD